MPGTGINILIPAAEALGDWPALELSPDDVEGVRHGHRVKAEEDTVTWKPCARCQYTGRIGRVDGSCGRVKMAIQPGSRRKYSSLQNKQSLYCCPLLRDNGAK